MDGGDTGCDDGGIGGGDGGSGADGGNGSDGGSNKEGGHPEEAHPLQLHPKVVIAIVQFQVDTMPIQ